MSHLQFQYSEYSWGEKFRALKLVTNLRNQFKITQNFLQGRVWQLAHTRCTNYRTGKKFNTKQNQKYTAKPIQNYLSSRHSHAHQLMQCCMITAKHRSCATRYQLDFHLIPLYLFCTKRVEKHKEHQVEYVIMYQMTNTSKLLHPFFFIKCS